MYEIAIAAGYYQIKIPGVTPDRIKLGAVKPTVYDDDFGIVMRLDDRQAELKLARVWVMAVSAAAAAAHLVGCVLYAAALAEARGRFEALLQEVAAAEYVSDEGRLSYEALAEMYSDFNSRQTFQAYLVPLLLLLLPLLLLLLMYIALLRKSIPPLKTLVYDKLRKRAADTAQHRAAGADPQQQAVNSAARKKYHAIRSMVVKLLVVVLYQIAVVSYKAVGSALIALALVLPVSSDCGLCGACQSLLHLSGTALQLQPSWAVLFHTLSLPLSCVVGVWGLQRSNRLAPAAFILAATNLLQRCGAAARRRVRRSKASGVLRMASRCFRYVRRGAVTAGAAAGKGLKKNRVFPGGSDAETSVQISPSMRA
jgi:hypothetical protein